MRRVLVLLFAVIALAMTACQDLIDPNASTSTPSSSTSPQPEGDEYTEDDGEYDGGSEGDEPGRGARASRRREEHQRPADPLLVAGQHASRVG
jgi:hypothetical protein